MSPILRSLRISFSSATLSVPLKTRKFLFEFTCSVLTERLISPNIDLADIVDAVVGVNLCAIGNNFVRELPPQTQWQNQSP